MYKLSTAPWRFATVLLVILAPWPAHAQTASPLAAAGLIPDWRHIGNFVVDEALAGAASGPCKRVWYGPGEMLYVETGSGRLYQTSDLENWKASTAPVPPAATNAAVAILPERGAQTRAFPGDGSRVYAFGEYVYRSEDGGAHWENATFHHGASLLGGGIADLAIAPGNSDEIVTAGAAGVFRSADGGRSWSGLNEDLPNLPITRLLDLPVGDQGARIALNSDLNHDSAAAWPPGNKQAWIPASNTDLVQETQLRLALSAIRGANVTAIAIAGDFIYSGMQDGTILVSADGGASWQTFSPSAGAAGSGAVQRFWIDPRDPRVALAALGAAPADPLRTSAPVHVLHTVNGGAFWDNFTANLPDVAAHGVAADPASGALYAATDRGVFLAYADLGALGSAQDWTALAGLPDSAAMDVKLDAQGNLLWVALDGYGVYAALAPHRLRDPSVVSAADMIKRAAAPGSLVTILGAQVESVQAGGVAAPVLAATGGESQIQIPFEARGTALPLAGTFAGAAVNLPSLPLAAAAPVIFVARDGSPMLLDTDRGVMLDAMTAAHSGTRIQILATGLGRVTPAWPTGVPAPLDNPPLVAGNVHVYLDRAPVEVTRAELAPGYVGFYLVEIAVPKISNYGPAELYLDVDGASSNRVRVYIEP
jgi:uncharacterized protein (TIGR03437 family)